MLRRFLQRKGPDRPGTILFCYSDCEIGISEDEDDDEHEEECPISEFRLSACSMKRFRFGGASTRVHGPT